MASATVTSKGQVTIPERIREFLRVSSGDRIDFAIDAGGQVVVTRSAGSVKALRGLLHRPGRRPVSLDAIEGAIATRHGRRR